MTRKQTGPADQTPDPFAPDRRQVLEGAVAVLSNRALPAVVLTSTVLAARPGGWILTESDQGVS